jgi:hypothetical protein
VVATFVERQGEHLTGGVVVRQYVPLQRVGTHPRSGMPLSREHRVFVLDGEPLIVARYWSDAEHADDVPFHAFREVMKAVESRFFTMDLALGEDGRWWVLELGDGQVAGLLDTIEPRAFYYALAQRLLG